MITEKAIHKLKILEFWKRYGLEATEEAFSVKRRSLFYWKKRLQEGNNKVESLNEKSKAPIKRRKRLWDEKIIDEVQIIRLERPNLGKSKIHTLLNKYCFKEQLKCPQESTIGRLIKDLGGLRMYPEKISHYGKTKKFKRKKKLRKPKDFVCKYPGHLVALDTVERYFNGKKIYIITFEDIYSRFSFAKAFSSHSSNTAKEFFEYCLRIFPFPIKFVLTDNGSEFAKDFSDKLKELHLNHYHTYPRTPKMNAHIERFNRTIQDDYVDYHQRDLEFLDRFNNKLLDWLFWYNAERPHYAFKNKFSPLEFMMSLETNNFNLPQKCNLGWTYTQN
jgi:transposase InsO family protein